ncbi:MAG: hypothetical protein CM1200mP6_09110 [Anaerolineaceae bacterium]|nr:MAG: hypothetical protein CM1200mP6_09110 [Anaerolineaceae bacterium]
MAALAGVQARPVEEEYDGTLDIRKLNPRYRLVMIIILLLV